MRVPAQDLYWLEKLMFATVQLLESILKFGINVEVIKIT